MSFFLAKELLEPIRPIAECLQGRLQEVYFGFKKITEIMKHYKTLRENVHTEPNRIYGKALLLSTEIGSEEGMPRVIRGRQTRPNPEVASACDYWRVTITIPFLDSIISEMESRFAEDKRAHFELCALIPEVIREQDVQAICSILSSKWKHLLLEEGNLPGGKFIVIVFLEKKYYGTTLPRC